MWGKVSFWCIWCTVPYWRGTLTILWSDEREGSRSTRWRQRSRSPEHRRLEERVSTMVTTRANDETDGLTTQSPLCHLPLTMLTTESTKKLWWLDLEDTQNWYDVTSWWLRHVWDTKLIEIIKTVCKWRQRQHCLSQYSRRRSRRVYQYDLKNRVREHD